MSGAIVVFVVWFAVVLAGAGVGVRAAPRVGPARRWSRLTAEIDGLGSGIAQARGRYVAAALVYLAGGAAIIVVCWPLGLLAHALQGSVDWPVFHWFQHRQLTEWSSIWWKLTNIGSPNITQLATVVAAVFFGVVWLLRHRAWWKPVVILCVGYCLEKYLQIILQDVVHRGHPPTTLGTYPSGGCGRVTVVYGMIIVLFISWLGPRSKRLWAAGLSLLAFLLSIQAYARLYNLEHWVTDIVGGCVFGALLLTVMAATWRVLDPVDPPQVRRTTTEADDPEAQREPRHAARSTAQDEREPAPA